MRVNIIMVSNAGSKMRKRADPLMGEEISRLDVVGAESSMIHHQISHVGSIEREYCDSKASKARNYEIMSGTTN